MHQRILKKLLHHIRTWGVGSLVLLLIFFASNNSVSAEPSADKRALKFGVFPMLAVDQMDKVYSPVATEFARVLGRSVLLRTKSSYAQFRQELESEMYDIALVQPFDYVIAKDLHGYLPLARFQPPLSAIIVVREGAAALSLQELKGKTIALPPATAAVSNMGKKAFIDAGMDLHRDVILKYMKSHDSCMQQVIAGSADACITAQRALSIFEARWGKHLVIIAETPAIPNTLFVAHKRVSAVTRDKILKTLVSWPEASEIGKKFLKDSSNTRMVPASDAEYNVVRDFPKFLEKE